MLIETSAQRLISVSLLPVPDVDRPFDAGNIALLRLVRDERIDSRTPCEDEDAAPVG